MLIGDIQIQIHQGMYFINLVAIGDIRSDHNFARLCIRKKKSLNLKLLKKVKK